MPTVITLRLNNCNKRCQGSLPGTEVISARVSADAGVGRLWDPSTRCKMPSLCSVPTGLSSGPGAPGTSGSLQSPELPAVGIAPEPPGWVLPSAFSCVPLRRDSAQFPSQKQPGCRRGGLEWRFQVFSFTARGIRHSCRAAALTGLSRSYDFGLEMPLNYSV